MSSLLHLCPSSEVTLFTYDIKSDIILPGIPYILGKYVPGLLMNMIQSMEHDSNIETRQMQIDQLTRLQYIFAQNVDGVVQAENLLNYFSKKGLLELVAKC